ncbi:hypothetical protein NDR89_19625 [Cupriavidus gilardii]|uniref:Integrase n=1 Tax=Cupriavidus gilardii TaxID=82541 RepID=A0ABY4VNN7_9BURK|nr:hypothetical protein [Cupriavidus gilardii]USE78849.1 hypothetical protein NDR89_19625 [Cupriavidus gilardii]
MAIVELKISSPIEIVNKDQVVTIREDNNGKPSIIGKLKISRGTLEWWPRGNKVNAHPIKWAQFAQLMEEQVPRKRVKKKIARKKAEE